MGRSARPHPRAAPARGADPDRYALRRRVRAGGAGAGAGGPARRGAQRQAGRRRSRHDCAGWRDRQHHDRHQHGGARHRHPTVRRRARGRRPACHPDRKA
ncbi:hypothetical protein G6F35_018386 [Rhizopus arrhizus]|nr:hypothetical protein G6F35_018386 [Rhizopus arrhizus]